MVANGRQRRCSPCSACETTPCAVPCRVVQHQVAGAGGDGKVGRRAAHRRASQCAGSRWRRPPGCSSGGTCGPRRLSRPGWVADLPPVPAWRRSGTGRAAALGQHPFQRGTIPERLGRAASTARPSAVRGSCRGRRPRRRRRQRSRRSGPTSAPARGCKAAAHDNTARNMSWAMSTAAAPTMKPDQRAVGDELDRHARGFFRIARSKRGPPGQAGC